MENVSGHVEVSTHTGSKKKGDWKPRPRGPVVFLRYRVPDASKPSGVREVKERLGKLWVDAKGKPGKGRPARGYLTEDMAENQLGKRLAEAEEGKVKKQAKAAAGPTFAEVCTEFLRFVREVRKIDPKTARDYEGVINGYLLAEFGADASAAQITGAQVNEYAERLVEEGKLSNRTIVRHLTVGTGVYKRAIQKEKWGITRNPFSAEFVERPTVAYDPNKFDVLSPDEIELLAVHADNKQDAAIFQTAAYTGLRQGELLGLRWKWIDFVDGWVHVRKNFSGGEEKAPKGGRSRSVPMPAPVVTVLAKLKERDDFTGDEDLVFVNEVGGHVDHFELRKRFYTALEAAGLQRMRFHDLRHTFGTTAIRRLDPRKVQGYMGHQHFTTTQRYLNHKPQPEDAAALSEAFGVSAGPTAPNKKSVSKSVAN